MNISELKTEIKKLNKQINTVETDGADVWQKTAEIDAKITLIHNQRQEQLRALNEIESQLIEALAVGKTGKKLTDELTRLKTITSIPVERITEQLEEENLELKKQQSSLLQQVNSQHQHIQLLEKALEVRKRIENGDKQQDINDWLHFEKRYSQYEIDELLKLVA